MLYCLALRTGTQVKSDPHPQGFFERSNNP